MTRPSHTRGPWEFRVYAGGCTIVSKHDAPGRSVRDWLKGVEVKVEAAIDDDQGNAHEASPDALLIAAAPELLEALQRILSDEDVALSRPDYEFAHAAIAKAGGQS